MMRVMNAIAITGTLLAGLAAASGASAAPTEFYNSAEILKWMNSYRSKPDPVRAAIAIHQLSGFGELRSPESAGVYVGFAAGVLASNPTKAAALVNKMLPLPAEDQWLVVRAIAYSGIPQWRMLLTDIAPRVTARGPMLQKYVAGKLPTLRQFTVQKAEPAWTDRFAEYMSFNDKPKAAPIALLPTPEVLDTFWGYYYATGSTMALQNIISLLPWSTDHDDIQRLTLGGMAKYTLAENASRDSVLLATVKTIRASESKDVQPVLDQVIEAADNVDVSHLRSEVLASLDVLKRKGSATRRNVTFWGQVGEGAIAAGCIGLAVASVGAAGIPCVVGGAATAGALNIWSSQN
jgi:hypothetical protein